MCARACSPAAPYCDLSRAPSWVNADGDTTQVFFQHDLLGAGTESDFTIIPASPFNTPIKRYSAFIQDQWRIIPTLTVNLGVRYDTETYYGCSRTPRRAVQGILD